jgi:hypothetical protein
MPKRVLDFDAMWGSDKLAACAAWAQGEYAWLYGLADASGCFEITNLRVIWGRVAAIRGDFTIERLEQVFAEFQDKGLLFVWEHEGKRYAHWTGSDVPGRLPPPSWRMRLERFAPPVPKQKLTEYMSRFARGRAALAGVGFRGDVQQESSIPKRDCKIEISELKEERASEGRPPSAQLGDQRLLFAECGEDSGTQNFGWKGNGKIEGPVGNSQLGNRQAAGVGGREGIGHGCSDAGLANALKVRFERDQAQDLGLDLGLDGNLNEKWEVGRVERQSGPGEAPGCSRGANREKEFIRTDLYSSSANSNANQNLNARPHVEVNPRLGPPGPRESQSLSNSRLVGSSREGCAEPAEEVTNAGKRIRSPQVRSGSEMVRAPGTYGWREKELAVERELRVGQGPVCGPGRVKPEVLERIRRREAARAGSRSP